MTPRQVADPEVVARLVEAADDRVPGLPVHDLVRNIDHAYALDELGEVRAVFTTGSLSAAGVDCRPRLGAEER